jgi:hypothetical protein
VLDKIPAWVGYDLATEEALTRATNRQGSFRADAAIPNSSAVFTMNFQQKAKQELTAQPNNLASLRLAVGHRPANPRAPDPPTWQSIERRCTIEHQIC